MISCREIGIHSLQGFESSHLRSNYSWSKDTNHTDKAEEQMVLHFYIARMLRVWYLIQHALTLRWKTSKRAQTWPRGIRQNPRSDTYCRKPLYRYVPQYKPEDWLLLVEANRHFRGIFGPDFWHFCYDNKGKLVEMVPLMEENIDGDSSIPYNPVHFDRSTSSDESDVRYPGVWCILIYDRTIQRRLPRWKWME